MTDKELTLEKIQEMFPDDESARKYLSNVRWGKFASCPECGNPKAYFIEKGKRYKCANKSCFHKFSVTSKTVFESSNLPMNKWIYLFFMYSKSRGRCSSIDLCQTLEIAEKNEFFIREKIDFAWQYVEREGKDLLNIINDIFISGVFSYEKFKEIKEAPYYNNPYHLKDIDNISDPKQYNQLLRYTKYYINVYCRKWIFMDFASAQDVLSETFIYMSDNGIKEYDTKLILKLIWGTVNKMWPSFLNNHPKFSQWFKDHAKRQKENSVRNLKTTVVVDRLKALKDHKHKTRAELRNDIALIEKKRKEIKEKRRKKLVDNTDFISHFN